MIKHTLVICIYTTSDHIRVTIINDIYNTYFMNAFTNVAGKKVYKNPSMTPMAGKAKGQKRRPTTKCSTNSLTAMIILVWIISLKLKLFVLFIL